MGNVPVFIDISLEEQAGELRAYFKGLGAEISSEISDKGIEDDLHKIIGVCDACFKDTANAGQIEEVLNGIVSMLALVTGEKSENLIVAFCEKLTKAPSNIIGMTCLKVLWSLYQSLDNESPMRFHVYHALVILAGRTKQIDTIYKDMETLKSQFTGKGALTNEQMQKLLKLLHEVLRDCKRSEDASQVMIELLEIFVSEKLEGYQKFYENHREFISELGLKHEDNLTKMKLLTFMQLAETKSEIRFGEIQQHMQIGESEVEEFLIDVLKTKLVRAKIDQGNQVIHVSSTMHRSFTKEHWHKLHTLLTNWRSNLHTVREQVGHLAKAQIDLMHQTPA